jgi:S-adenosylmethionine:tRNA ribosyltransferase-isomerase
MIGTFQDFALQPDLRAVLPPLDFKLTPAQEAAAPAETRGLHRDQVRMLVSFCHNHQVVHSRFDRLPGFLHAGDVFVINTSATLKAALKVRRTDGTEMELHLSTRLPGKRWVVEIRQPAETGGEPFYSAEQGERWSLPGGGVAILQAPYPGNATRRRLWTANLELPMEFEAYLESYGFPIRYKYVRSTWPIDYYQNVYAVEPGSAEMPSAGRAFTAELITRLVARGILFAPLVLHTGVASLEEGEKPYAEYYRLPAATADLVNHARSAGGRVIAVGTTVVRAMQSAANEAGTLNACEGWTELVIQPDSPLTAIDGLLTGLHEPRSSHLSMLLALAGYEHIYKAYQQALEGDYLWHEFGDLHLILP